MEQQPTKMIRNTVSTASGNTTVTQNQFVPSDCADASLLLSRTTSANFATEAFPRTRFGSVLSKWTCGVTVLILAACGGSLSDEQRKKVKEGLEDIKITQISDTEIVTAAMDEGQKVFDALKKSGFSSTSAGELERAQKVRIRYIKPGTGDALEVENQIIQAYIVGSATGATQDNIQKLRSGTATSLQDYDTLLYSRPIVTSLPDGSVNVEGVWNIYVAKRDIVRELSRK